MSVSLKHFVDVDIKQHVSAAVIGTRKTVALFTNEKKQGEEPSFLVTATDYESKCEGMPTTIQYLKIYFDHGGISAIVIQNIPSNEFTVDKIMSLPQDYICVAYAYDDQPVGMLHVQSTAQLLSSNADFYGINRRILLNRHDETSLSNAIQADCLATKYSAVTGAEMTIAAYLSKINVYDIDSVYDYMYTIENIVASELTDAEYENLISKNLNVDIELANQVRNCGGNMTDGSDIVNSYCLTILHQTVTARLVELLSQKIKSSDGIAKIYAVISQELGNYLTCGYLTTDKVWTDPDLVISYNNENYTVIETGTALTDGYVVKVLPFSSLTENDKALHKTPPIYIVLASQYGIRAITINGEVI